MFRIRVVAVVVLCMLCAGRPSCADEVYFLTEFPGGGPMPGGQCRVLDTRNLGGPIPNGTEYSFKVRGQVGGLQGGLNGCGLPIEASGAVLNVVAIPYGPGHIQVYSLGNSPVGSNSRLNFQLPGAAIANEMLVRLNQPINTLVNEIVIRPSTSSAHLIVDLVGWTGEANPTFPIIRGRVFGAPFQFQTLGFETYWHVLVETNLGGNCSDITTCFEIECSNQPGAGEICQVAQNNGCIEVQGYQRPYASPQWGFLADRRKVGTIVRLFSFPPCPWE